MKFLLIEDDDQFSGALIQVLASHHYLVDRAMDGETGREMAEIFPYDLILLDWMLPKLDGIQTCQQLRATGNSVPIILMTARDAGTDKVAGLDAGADDYLIKPFEFEELLARIRALLRRAEGIASPVLQWGDLYLDPRRAEVSYRNEPISLTPKEYGLLELFLRNPNRVFSLDELLDKLWTFEDAPHISAVRTQIKGLRRKLKQVGLTTVIETLYGLGYRLMSAEQQPERTHYGEPILSQSSPSIGRQIDLTALWQPVREAYTKRVTDLKNSLKELQPGRGSEQVRQQIVTETHALAGSLGSFGFPMVSTYCQEIENILLVNSCLDTQHISQLKALITSVQQALTSSEILPESTPPSQNSFIDSLTGISNRQKSTQDLSRLMRLAHRQGQPLCFALLDFKDFEHISRKYGQQVNDQILQLFSDRLGTAFRLEDIVARWSTTEFMVGLYGARREDGTQRLKHFLQDWQDEQLSFDNQTFQVTFMVGIAVYPEDAKDLKGLYQAASGALSQEKVEGR